MRFPFQRKRESVLSIDGRKYAGVVMIYEGEQLRLGHEPAPDVLGEARIGGHIVSAGVE